MERTSNVRDVATRAGVSIGTVSNVLNYPEKVAGPTIERVRRAIDELGFVPNGAARQLRQGRSAAIGFVVLDVANPFFADVVRAVEERVAGSGTGLLIANSGEQPARERAHLDLFEQQRISGLLVSPVAEVYERLRELRRRGIASVLVDRKSTEADFSSVSVDDLAGGRLAAQHLLEAGRRRLAFVGGPLDLAQVRDRLAGATDAVRAVGGAAIEIETVPALTAEQGARAAVRLLERPARPDAVFAANDLVALGVLQGLTMRGVRVPDDIAIVGYDDIAFAASAAVPISSIRQPRDRLGAEATDLLLAEMDGSPLRRQIVFTPELVRRASS